MVPPSFTPDSRLPPHQQHRKQIHLLYTDGICLFIARHVNVCQSVAAYLLLTACIHPSIRYLSSGCSIRSYVLVRSSEMYSPYAGSCASHQPAASVFPGYHYLFSSKPFFCICCLSTPSPSLLSRSFSYSIRISINPCGGAVTPADSRSFGLKNTAHVFRRIEFPARPAEAFPQ